MTRRLAALALTAALAAGLGACAAKQGESFTVTPRVQVKETEVAVKPKAPRGFQEPPTDEPDPAPPAAAAAR
jgi:hypothetical protein